MKRNKGGTPPEDKMTFLCESRNKCGRRTRTDNSVAVQSRNVFPFRRKWKLNNYVVIIIVTVCSVMLFSDDVSGQFIDLGYGRQTSSTTPRPNISHHYTNYNKNNQQIRDLRDYPDHEINWLSPDPFADIEKKRQQALYNQSLQYDVNNYNRERERLQYQNPNVRLPGYIVEEEKLKPEHRGDTGDPNDPNYKPPPTGFGDERYDGFGRNLPVGSGGGGTSGNVNSIGNNQRSIGGVNNNDWNNRQYPQTPFNGSRSGSMNISPGNPLLGPPNNPNYQNNPNNPNYQNNPNNPNYQNNPNNPNYQNNPNANAYPAYGPNLPPSADGSQRYPPNNQQGSDQNQRQWNNIPGYPGVGPSSNLPGMSGDNYFPNGTRRTGAYPSSYYPNGTRISNFGSSTYPGSPSSYPNYPGSGSNRDNPYYPGNNVQQQPYNPRPYDSTYRSNSYPGAPGSSSGGGSYDGRNNRYPGPVNYPGRVTFNPGDPYVNIWNEQWSTTTYRPTALGVLGKWRPDLQGQQRPEDINQVPQPVYVTTNYGRIQGFKVKIYDGPWVPLPARPGIANVDKAKSVVTSFMGVPYARAPVNEGRFRPPRSHSGWQLHQAVEFGPACPQPARFFGFSQGIVQVDEDCLYLNVHSPDVGSGVEGSPFPVIFYIHDGDFIHGASNQFPPHQLVAWYKLVVVTVNFRLGALGFLSTADEFSPGNYGMLDLSMALKWVHENIRSFNGDPERITVVGLGSGAAAAGLLMVAPRTRAYVKNVVALEGALTADWAAIIDRYRAQNTTQLYSFKMGCWQEYETTSWKMVQCLRSRSWQELANLELDPDVGTFPWAPAVDRTFKTPKDDYLHDWKEEDWRFLPDSPYNLLKHGDYQFVKYMTGFSRQSAADLLYNNKSLSPNFIVTRDWFDEQIHLWVKKYNYTLNPEGVFSAIKYAYTFWPDPYNTTHLREEYINFLSDALYRSPVDQTVKLLLARGIPVHSYFLNYTLEGLRLPFWREVPRGMEYYLLSGAPFMDPEFYPERLRVERSVWTEGDRNMSNFFMTAVANMAHYGQPTPREVLGIHWESCLPSDLRYLALNGTNNSTMQRNYRQRELTFWTEYMPFVVGREVPTYPPTTEYWWEPNEPLQIAFWTVSGVCLILVVALVACCLLWRAAKKQRDRIYDDLGLGSEHLGLGTIVGDEISDYADTLKTMDSMDSGVKLTSRHADTGPGTRREMQSLYSSQPQIHNNGHHGAGTSGPVPVPIRGDRFPTPIKRAIRDQGRDTPQTQV